MKKFLLTTFSLILVSLPSFQAFSLDKKIHVFEIKEIEFKAEKHYDNPYVEVECWVELKGPGFNKKIYGYWDGGDKFIVRLTAINPGKWTWKSYSNQDDSGLKGKTGSFSAIKWSEKEKIENPLRRGFLKPSENGHALVYADGKPFFMLGDTWWASSTWRYPLKGIAPANNYIPKEGISFEEAISFRKKQGYNTIAMIAAYPNWKADKFPNEYKNEDNIGARQAWEKWGTKTAKDMHDEAGNVPFEKWDKSEVIADFDRLNPKYFQSLDKKLSYLNEQGFIAFLETVRRDHGPSWKKYFDWPGSFSRYVQYIIARYGAYNIIFSGIHLDWIPRDFSLSADEFNEALTHHYKKYGGLPYEQPYTTLIEVSTYKCFGHGSDAPWLTMHSVGNQPRNHGFYPILEEMFKLEPPYPAANLEPYYPGWRNHNNVDGERADMNSDRDHYFARAQMYGSVLSGGLSGHIYGTGAYDGTTTGEVRKENDRPYIWDALNYASGAQLPFLADFMLSEGQIFQSCVPAKEMLIPHKAKGAPEKGLDGWAFLLISPKKDLGFLYFENKSEIPKIIDLLPERKYMLNWFDPVKGEWLNNPISMSTDRNGVLILDQFPDKNKVSCCDWALKIKAIK